jgi:hypothetical protein
VQQRRRAYSGMQAKPGHVRQLELTEAAIQRCLGRMGIPGALASCAQRSPTSPAWQVARRIWEVPTVWLVPLRRAIPDPGVPRAARRRRLRDACRAPGHACRGGPIHCSLGWPWFRSAEDAGPGRRARGREEQYNSECTVGVAGLFSGFCCHASRLSLQLALDDRCPKALGKVHRRLSLGVRPGDEDGTVGHLLERRRVLLPASSSTTATTTTPPRRQVGGERCARVARKAAQGRAVPAGRLPPGPRVRGDRRVQLADRRRPRPVLQPAGGVLLPHGRALAAVAAA